MSHFTTSRSEPQRPCRATPGRWLPGLTALASWMLAAGLIAQPAAAGENAGAATGPKLLGSGGVEIRVLQSLETSFIWNRNLPGPYPQEISLVGARNGCFSGRIEVVSQAPIRGLQVEAGDLAQAGGAARIPAAQIRVRYSEAVDPAKSFVYKTMSNGTTLGTNEGRFDGLSDQPPAEVPVRTEKIAAQLQKGVEWRFAPPPVAIQPVWVTFRVGADAAPGEYVGKVTVRTASLAATEIPVRLRVIDWRIPDPKEGTVHHNIYQSHDSVALFYNVPLWSDRHFELMGKSLALAQEVSNRLCIVHLIAPAFCMGNSESMVRWVKQPDGSFKHDFTVLDRYLDLYAKHGGKPKLLVVSVWARGGDGDKTVYGGKVIDLPASERRPRMKVTALDPATGKTEPMEQPAYGTPEGLAFWKPVLAELRAKLEKRGWWDVVALGHGDDSIPMPATVAQFKEIWPDAKWMSTSHMNPPAYRASLETKETVPVGYSEHVWGAGWLYEPGAKSTALRYKNGYPMPWKRERLEWGHPRVGIIFVDALFDSSRYVAWRFAPEAALQGNLSGVGRLGIDFFPPPAMPVGRGRSLAGDTNLGPAYSTLAVVCPAKDGPAATERFEAFREGNQLAEAVVCVRKAMDTKKLPPDLAKRCEALLDERATRYCKITTSKKSAGDPFDWRFLEVPDWQEIDGRLFALAGEVSRATGGR